MRVVNDAPARSKRCLKPYSDLLTRNRYVNVHRMSQGLALVKFLHPDCRAVSKGIYRIIISHRHVAQHSAPEADIYILVLRCDCNLHFLDGGPIRKRIVLPCNRRNGPRKFNVSRLKLPEISR